MEIGNLIPHIESLIFASEKPLTSLEITELINNAFGFMEDKIVLDQVESSLEGIVEKYRSEFYPFEVRESGGGWQFLTKKDYHKTVAQLNGDKFLKRLSSAALETLSIIAYKQPVTKAEIEAIRGVSSDYAIQKLLEKELVMITGRNEALPGHPLVYATSKNFMDYFGINTAEDLPKLKEVFDDSMVSASVVAALEESAAAAMENGEPLNPVEEEGTVAQEGENAEEINTTITTEENITFKVDEDGVLIEEVFITETEEDPGPEGEDEITAESEENIEVEASAENDAEESEEEDGEDTEGEEEGEEEDGEEDEEGEEDDEEEEGNDEDDEDSDDDEEEGEDDDEEDDDDDDKDEDEEEDNDDEDESDDEEDEEKKSN
ncbi:SMC-Scp complex subunit ScpB [Pseudobacter ginsenosidimutans]|uniref:Segregation and condensation protein B n=1 Tax=Pseudobacter ginsenosidimutans TaxID=661488 RepID=A0A4V2F182_9BACT|nr:SMC-Scp complex subunit ScpB [Pseudobacter ginsenosidimutans]QEC40566.1 SMC-Scp complex subunit ScpB [Pseudobacter ginsenosidimutans]RZS72721.1 segregation and condensation protein B [Pseudobacter ginsenosidimutans]